MAVGRLLGFDLTGNGAVRPAVPENLTKEQYEVDRMTRC